MAHYWGRTRQGHIVCLEEAGNVDIYRFGGTEQARSPMGSRARRGEKPTAADKFETVWHGQIQGTSNCPVCAWR